jgi:ketosteroid isomerase-like protein
MLTSDESNIAAVEAGYRRYNERDRSQPWPDDEAAAFWVEDAEYRSAREDPDSEIHRGMEAIRLQFQRWHDAYPDLRAEILDVRVGEDKVMVWVHLSGHGAGSGVPIEMELAHVVALRDGKIAYMAEFFDRAEALEHVGL